MDCAPHPGAFTNSPLAVPPFRIPPESDGKKEKPHQMAWLFFLAKERQKVVWITIPDPDEDHSKRKLLSFPASAVGILCNKAFSWNELHNATFVHNDSCIA